MARKRRNNNNIVIVPLGGVEEIGINSTAIQYGDEIIIIDCGLGFPENDQYGIDYLIPNIDFLKRNISKIKGLIITHAHYDHIGALNLILPKLKFPKVYAPPFASEVIKKKLEEDNLLDKTTIEIYKEEDVFNFGKLSTTFFRVNHSTPDAFGVIIKTPLGSVIHTGDFKIDTSPEGEEPANLTKIAKTGSEGVLALLSDSTNAFKEGFSKSESKITDILRNVVEKSEGRIIVATFSQLVTRINQLIFVAQNEGRKVAVSGRSLETTIQIARKLKYIKAPDDLFVSLKQISKLPKNKQMIFTTGHQGETMAALSRIARGEHKDVQIQKGDTVILSSSVIPGNDLVVQKMIDDLSTQGAKVFHQGIMDLHAGGHGYQEDQKLMINLVKPKFFIPVHGYQSFLAEHARTAQSLGIPEKNTIVAKRGEEIILSQNSIRTGKKYKSKPVIVSGLGVGDIGQQVLKEREQLANYGIVLIFFDLDRKTLDLKAKPKVISKGFVFERNLHYLIEGIEREAEKSVKKHKDSVKKPEALFDKVERDIARYISKEIKREPMILPILI